jgi:hypothetical protein
MVFISHLPPYSPHLNIAERLRRRRDEVLRFMTDLSVPFDNNGSERDLQMIKLQQKISGCFRAEDGARDFCHVRNYLSSARKQGHSVLYCLEREISYQAASFSEHRTCINYLNRNVKLSTNFTCPVATPIQSLPSHEPKKISFRIGISNGSPRLFIIVKGNDLMAR